MRYVYALCLVLWGGCFYIGKNQLEDVAQKPSCAWSSRDCLTIVVQAMAHNIFDQYSPNVKVIATPYFPVVITAINRTEQRLKHLSEEDYRLNMDQQFVEDLGVYIDWRTGRLVDSRGNYFKNVSQLDSIALLISIENKNWPCVSPILVFRDAYRPLLTPGDYPCYTPDITHLEDSIYLFNDKNGYVKPTRVWGRQRTELTMEETLIAKFKLRRGDYHFLADAKNMFLVIRGFDASVKLELPLRLLEMEFRQF
jgi:hypothetical protein